ncbi:MAG: hypothetical protein WEA04_03115 [Candidatus Andersenbacteria bacterium]
MNVRETIKLHLLLPQPAADPPHPPEVISVSPATRRIAFAYERFRNTLEPDEEDILRRKAIYRILERRLPEDRPPVVTATAMLQELIRAHYIPPIDVRYAQHIAARLAQVQALHAQLALPVFSWFLRLVAVAIDRDLYPRTREEALIQLMYQDTLARTVWADDLVTDKDKATQLYIACHRTLFAADDYEIMYHYFLHHFPQWQNPQWSNEELTYLARRLPKFREQLEHVTTHPARDRLTRLLKPVAVPYRILRDIIHDYPESFAGSEEDFVITIREALTRRMRRIRERMGSRAWHSILFLFLTKTLIAVIIELPYELLILGRAHWLALAANISFHPLLLFGLATTARLPGQRNSDRVVDQVQRIVTGRGELPTIIISATRTYGALTWSFFAIIYAVLFMAIFGLLFSVLDRLGFSLLAMGMFVVFLGLVSFLSIRIRHAVDVVRVVPKREGAITAIISFLSLPVLEFGRWLAQNISQINVALFIMDRVLEAPFKLLIDVTEEWFAFVRDRREEIT